MKMKKANKIVYSPSMYGGIDIIEIDDEQECLFINHDLYDGPESAEEFIENHDVFNSIVECAEIVAFNRASEEYNKKKSIFPLSHNIRK